MQTQRARVNQTEGGIDTREHALSRTNLARQVRVRNSRTRDAPTGSRPLPRLKERVVTKERTGISNQWRYPIGRNYRSKKIVLLQRIYELRLRSLPRRSNTMSMNGTETTGCRKSHDGEYNGHPLPNLQTCLVVE